MTIIEEMGTIEDKKVCSLQGTCLQPWHLLIASALAKTLMLLWERHQAAADLCSAHQGCALLTCAPLYRLCMLGTATILCTPGSG